MRERYFHVALIEERASIAKVIDVAQARRPAGGGEQAPPNGEHKKKPAAHCVPTGCFLSRILEREKGFEPSTSTLARWHSTTELLPRKRPDVSLFPGEVKGKVGMGRKKEKPRRG